MGERDLIIDYRVRVITTGLVVSWFGFVIFALWILSLEDVDTAATIIALGGFLFGLVILTFAPWRSLLASRLGDWLLVVWTVAAILAVMMFEVRRALQPNGIGFLLITFFAAATLVPNRTLITIGGISGVAYAATVVAANGFDTVALGGHLVPFIGAIIFVLLLSVGIRTQLDQTNEAYHQLAQRESALAIQERELSQLYDVSRTIGAGSKLKEVLPELVGRVAQSVNARIGLILLYDPEAELLDLMSPIWVSGHTVHADDIHLALDEYGIGQRVFMSGDGQVLNELAEDDVRDRLVGELEAATVAAVALRIENRTIGVLLVGDKPGGFSEGDLETLESVAAPAALVLNQMTRYEEARSASERMAELAQMKTDFVSVVSHELRTPLTSIIGAL
ncbi:MAG: GAF domain-containing protein, partial [Acidimicrobiia bacterium]